jgi:SAM-dependent methyltransferase
MPEKKIGHIQNTESQTYTGTQELRDSEVGLIGYSTEIVRKFFAKMNLKSRIIEENGCILEFGAGTGFLAELFRSQYQIEPDCIELDPSLVTLVKSKQFRCFQFLRETSQDYAAIYTSNVLEHIEDDEAILRELYDSLIPGGVIGIYVPAHPILYSMMDKEIGHIRRYTRSELKNKVQDAGFTIQSLTYDDFIGFFASLFVKIVGYKNGAKLGSKNSLIFYDKIIYPVSRTLDFVGFRHILGKNLILVAIKTN